MTESGHAGSRMAIATAILRNSRSQTAGGNDVSADTRAKAVAAMAEWERLKAVSASDEEHARDQTADTTKTASTAPGTTRAACRT